MAAIFPDEGMDTILGIFPKSGAVLSTLYLCLFTSQTATTVIAHNQALANITESAYTGYARQALAAATWGAIAEVGSSTGRITTYPQVAFPANTGGAATAINGFFLGDAATPTKCIAQANFNDGVATTLQTNDVIKVTPSIQFNH